MTTEASGPLENHQRDWLRGLMRTAIDVQARFDTYTDASDPGGHRRETLFVYVGKLRPLEQAAIADDACAYLTFTFALALRHRGQTLPRALAKLDEWRWLLGCEVPLEQDVRNFAVPVLRTMARLVNLALPDALVEWPDSGPCRPGCTECAAVTVNPVSTWVAAQAKRIRAREDLEKAGIEHPDAG